MSESTEDWNTQKYSFNRWPSLKVHHWATILRFLTILFTVLLIQLSLFRPYRVTAGTRKDEKCQLIAVQSKILIGNMVSQHTKDILNIQKDSQYQRYSGTMVSQHTKDILNIQRYSQYQRYSGNMVSQNTNNIVVNIALISNRYSHQILVKLNKEVKL